jgi:hypothetical protein
MNPVTKSVVIVSTLAAAFVQLYLATRLLYPQLFFYVAAAFVVAFVVGARSRGAASGAVMAVSYLAPAAYVIWPGFENFGFEIVWSLPLLGLLVSGREAWRWHLPARWRWPLVTWALVVAAAWPFVFLREVDFYIDLLPLPGVANTSIGITPWDAVTAVTYWTLVHNLGLLWFDRLFGWFARDEVRFRKAVVAPLVFAVAVAGAVGAYQAFVDLYFVNPHLWPHMRRASGTFGDANTFGMAAALWGPVCVVLALRLRAPWSAIASVAAVALSLTAVLTSGSRTGLAAIAIGFAALLVEVFRRWRHQGEGERSFKGAASLVAGIGALALVVLVVAQGSSITTVVGRGVLGYLPGVGDVSIGDTLYELLWDRNTYGPAAVLMIQEHPVAGVGVGAFHTLVHDYGMAASQISIVPDNAQSWYRHHLAELGGLGSLPWIAWCLVFAATLFSRAKDDGDRVGIGVLRGTLVAFGLTSLLGVPGQSLPIALTFWTLVFWFATLHGTPAAQGEAWPKVAWSITLAFVVMHAAITFADARGDLRPRNRSMRFGWDYRYGLGNIERDAAGQPERRTSFDHRSLSVSPVKGRVMKFAAWIDHPDGDERPVHVRVWADAKLIYDGELKRSAAILQDIPASPGQTHIVIESEISRLWRPRDFGRDDPRVLGLAIRDWVWE